MSCSLGKRDATRPRFLLQNAKAGEGDGNALSGSNPCNLLSLQHLYTPFADRLERTPILDIAWTKLQTNSRASRGRKCSRRISLRNIGRPAAIGGAEPCKDQLQTGLTAETGKVSMHFQGAPMSFRSFLSPLSDAATKMAW